MVRRVLMALGMVCVLGTGAGAQVKLEQKVTEGRAVRTKVVMKTDQVLTIMGTDVKTVSQDVASIATVTGTRKADGTIPIDVAIESVKTKLDVNGMEFVADSDDKDSKIELPQLAFLVDLVKALKGSSFTIVLDSKDAFKFVEGTEKNLTRVPNLPPAALEALKHRLDADRIKQAHEQSYTTFPDGLVREGEPWERTETLDLGGQSLTFKRRYEYKGTTQKGGKTLDKIDVKALEIAYKMEPSAASPAKVTKSDLKVASSQGMILFDRAAGAVVERTEKTRITGDMTLAIGDKDLPTTIDLTLDSTTTTEPLKK